MGRCFLVLWPILLSMITIALGASKDDCYSTVLKWGPRIANGEVATDELHYLQNKELLAKGLFNLEKYFAYRHKSAASSWRELTQEGPEELLAFLDGINLGAVKDGSYRSAYWEMVAHPRRMKKIANKIPLQFHSQTQLAHFALWYYQQLHGKRWIGVDVVRLMQVSYFYHTLSRQLALEHLPLQTWQDVVKGPGSKILLTLLMNSHLWLSPTGPFLFFYLPLRQISLWRFDFLDFPVWQIIQKEKILTLEELEAYFLRTGQENHINNLRKSRRQLQRLQLQNKVVVAILLGSYGFFFYHTGQETFHYLHSLEEEQNFTNSSMIVDRPTHEEAVQYLQEVMARHYQGGDLNELKILQDNVSVLLEESVESEEAGKEEGP